MADVITQNNVVQVTMTDAGGNKQSFNIDNPKDNLTLAQIRTALNAAISSGYWYSNKSEPFTAVNSATITQTKKIKLDNSSVEITLTPATINTTNSTESILVEGSAVRGAYFTDLPTGEENDYWATVSPDTSGYTVEIFTSNETRSEDTNLTLMIITIDRTISMPVTFAKTT